MPTPTVYSLWLSGYGEDKPLVQHVKTLNAARKAAASANKDFHTSSVGLMYHIRS